MSKYALKRFGQIVKAIDQTNPEIELQVRGIFEKFMTGIGACYYEVSYRSPTRIGNSNSVILKSEWCSIDDQQGHPRHLNYEEQSYTDQTAYAYFESKELWVCAAEPDSLLHRCKTVDELRINGDGHDDIPNYVDPDDIGKSKTSILFPLKRNGFTIGVMCLEFPEVIERQGETKEFIHQLAKIVTSFFEKKKNSIRSSIESNDAFKELGEDLNIKSIRLPGDKLHLFFGYSDRADELVISTIKETINLHFDDDIKLLTWEDIDALGKITTNLCRAIDETDYALFYLSELTPERQPTQALYQDNPNVLFECGIKHGRYTDSETGAAHWLPIREHPELTGPPPFDFAGHNMIYINRDSPDGLKAPLEQDLRNALQTMLKA